MSNSLGLIEIIPLDIDRFLELSFVGPKIIYASTLGHSNPIKDPNHPNISLSFLVLVQVHVVLNLAWNRMELKSL